MVLVNDSISYFCALFDKQFLPLIVGIRISGNDTIIPLYLHGTGRKVYYIQQSVKKIYRFIEQTLLKDRTLVTNDFKSILTGFDFILPREKLKVYDVFQPPPPTMPNTLEEASYVVHSILSELQGQRLHLWQNVAANASVVYESLERQGIMVGGYLHKPKWTHRTVSGRSKNTGFNLQGTSAKDHISGPHGSQLDYFINFDWRAADIRIAAILSGDSHLNEMSIESDPYLKLSEMLNMERKDCKLMLLRAINSIDIDNPVFQLFPDLREWMIAQKAKLDGGQPIASILGRTFFNAEKPRSAFNSTMQGSIAQAMQLTIRRVWELHFRLLTETHDSITIACTRNEVKNAMRTIANIMCRPFTGILASNPVFPVRVNIGKEWCKWQPCRLYFDVDKWQSC
jgi:hypothetical protein